MTCLLEGTRGIPLVKVTGGKMARSIHEEWQKNKLNALCLLFIAFKKIRCGCYLTLLSSS
jgi:hypothetical protein